jgi:hypothetical protein
MVYNILCGPGGRPYLDGGRACVATLPRGAGQRGWSDDAAPELGGLTSTEKTALASAWAADGLMEHASVASFARFSLSLLAVGAPAELVELAHRAALDEVRHARSCFALASRYASEEIAPGPFPLGDGVRAETDLARVAASAFEEGCIGETVAAVVAAERLAHASDPAVRAALSAIAADEARHAELAWKTVAWALSVGGSRVRDALERALAVALVQVCEIRHGAASGMEALARHGILDAHRTAQAAKAAMTEIIEPAVLALFSDRETVERLVQRG